MVLLQIFGFIFHEFPAHIKTCGGKFLLANLLERRDSTESVEDMLLREVEREREDKLCVICVDKEKCIMILPCRSYLNIICSQGFGTVLFRGWLRLRNFHFSAPAPAQKYKQFNEMS